MPEFIPGLKLSRLLYGQAVKPILDDVVPGLKYSAALIGSGSEVLGYDDEMSADHHWGPRVMLFVSGKDYESSYDVIDRAMRNRLPTGFLGYPTSFTEPNPDDNNTQLLQEIESGPVNHRIDVFTIRGYLLSYLNFDIDRDMEPADWLTIPEHKLLTVMAGDVFEDQIGLGRVRERFRYYPDDVWFYLLASGWNRIGQEEHLMGRAGLAGDETGSALIGARLVRDIMRLCFLMDRRYAPYPKWFGTAFRELSCAEVLSPYLTAALRAGDWQEREKALVPAYEQIAVLHNQLGITDPLPAKASNFFGRPFKVIELIGGFSNAIRSRISDPHVKRIADKGLIGGLDQISDSTDLLSHAGWRTSIRNLYE